MPTSLNLQEQEQIRYSAYLLFCWIFFFQMPHSVLVAHCLNLRLLLQRSSEFTLDEETSIFHTESITIFLNSLIAGFCCGWNNAMPFQTRCLKIKTLLRKKNLIQILKLPKGTGFKITQLDSTQSFFYHTIVTDEVIVFCMWKHHQNKDTLQNLRSATQLLAYYFIKKQTRNPEDFYYQLFVSQKYKCTSKKEHQFFTSQV